MAIQVYTVTSTTRLHLPESQWGKDVIRILKEQGYTVQLEGERTGEDTRDEAEMKRVHQLLGATTI